jgi:LuxR family transcriptional regulator, maltose regulon positive regulatory protein
MTLPAGRDQETTQQPGDIIVGAPAEHRFLEVESCLLEAIVRDALGDPAAAGRALGRALDLAGPDSLLLPFLLYPALGLLERHARQRTARASMLAEIRDRQATDATAAPPDGPQPPQPLLASLSGSEIRVLRYLPTNLTVPEIARELSLSPNTVRTHTRHLYRKLDAHTRTETVNRALALGLLTASRRP